MDLTAIAGCSLKFNKSVLLAMKLTAILLLAAVLQVSARSYSQTITIFAKGIRVDKLFTELKIQTGYSFLWDEQVLPRNQRVTIDVKGGSLEQVMEQCLKNLPLTYKIEQKVVFIIQKLAADPTAINSASLPPGSIKGIVYSESGLPLPNATITVKQSGKSTFTNSKGEFIISNIPENAVLIISYVGYTSRRVTVKGVEPISVVLAIAVNELDETIVQAYGTTTRRIATGNIGKVSAAEIERQPVMNPLLALQGKVAGLDVSQTNGFASAPVKVELRGRSTVNTIFTSDPLFIIDGVPFTVLELSGNSNYYSGSFGFLQNGLVSPAYGQSPFFSINPSDIESIEVLKDADATAIYGSRGANGVILITSKKGKAGKTKLDLHVQQGITMVTRYWHMMNTQQYLQMRREAYKNDNLVPDLSNGAYDLLLWDTTRYTDWQRAIYGHLGKTTDVEASLSGGQGQTNFRISTGYTRATNILTLTGADQRASVSFNLNHHSVDQRFSTSFNAYYSFAQNDMRYLSSGAALLPPNAPPMYDSAGSLNYNGYGAPNTSERAAYPFRTMFSPYKSSTNFLNSAVGINFQPVKGLKFSANLGYNSAFSYQWTYNTLFSQDPATSPTASTQYGNTKNANWLIEPQATYDAFIGKGKLNVLIGGSYQATKTDAINVSGSGYTSDDMLDILSAAPLQYNSNNSGEYKYARVFGRLTYNWLNKYILNLNASRDGSSRFGPGKEYGNFGSLAAAWIFTEEKWFENHIHFLSFGKLRSSYGATGSDGVGDYGYLTRWSYPDYSGYLPYNGNIPLAPMQHANPRFHWQTNKKFDASIDLGFIKDRIQFNATYYRNRCGDQLVRFPLPAFSGFDNVIGNWAALVQNAGFEFVLSARIIENKNWKWSVNFNTAINKNKLISYPSLDQSPYAGSLIVGKSINMIRLLHNTGVDPETGMYRFQDKNKNGSIEIDDTGKNPDDRYEYDMSPKFFGGLGMNLSYKNLQLSLFFNIKKQIGYNAYAIAGLNAGKPSNEAAEILGQQWQKPGDIASIARFSIMPQPNDNEVKNSDLGFSDASYIRLSNLSLSYTFPSNYIRKLGLESLNLFFHTNNLFTITRYKGLDPETQSFGSMPPPRILVGGLSLNF